MISSLVRFTVLAALLLAACTTEAAPRSMKVNDVMARPPAATEQEPGPSPEPTTSRSRPSPGADATASEGVGDAPSPGESQRPAPAFSPTEEPSLRDDIAVSATVSPTCARRGDTMTIDVSTLGGAGVAYNAMYAGEESGAAPPYGNGHGGNNGGSADQRGHWTDTWVVGASAPEGAARVEVVVGTEEGFGRTTASFAVANALTGRCSKTG
jgi:hypothetical protein